MPRHIKSNPAWLETSEACWRRAFSLQCSVFRFQFSVFGFQFFVLSS
jgi:hypothetical protein